MKKKVSIIWVIALSVLVILQFILITDLIFVENVSNDTDSAEIAGGDKETNMEQATENAEDEEEQETASIEVNYKRGVFSWEPGMAEPENRTEMYEVINKLDINEVYQYFDADRNNFV